MGNSSTIAAREETTEELVTEDSQKINTEEIIEEKQKIAEDRTTWTEARDNSERPQRGTRPHPSLGNSLSIGGKTELETKRRIDQLTELINNSSSMDTSGNSDFFAALAELLTEDDPLEPTDLTKVDEARASLLLDEGLPAPVDSPGPSSAPSVPLADLEPVSAQEQEEQVNVNNVTLENNVTAEDMCVETTTIVENQPLINSKTSSKEDQIDKIKTDKSCTILRITTHDLPVTGMVDQKQVAAVDLRLSETEE